MVISLNAPKGQEGPEGRKLSFGEEGASDPEGMKTWVPC